MSRSVRLCDKLADRRTFFRAKRPDSELLGKEIVEGLHRGEFIVSNVEDGVELGHVQNVVNFLGEIQELELASGVADCGVASDKFAHSRTVEIIDVCEIENDFFLILRDEITNRVAQVADFRAKNNTPADVDNGDMRDLAGVDRQ